MNQKSTDFHVLVLVFLKFMNVFSVFFSSSPHFSSSLGDVFSVIWNVRSVLGTSFLLLVSFLFHLISGSAVSVLPSQSSAQRAHQAGRHPVQMGQIMFHGGSPPRQVLQSVRGTIHTLAKLRVLCRKCYLTEGSSCL